MKRIYFFVSSCIVLMACNSGTSDQNSGKDTAAAAQVKPPAATEFADMKYADMGNKANAQLSSGDMAGWLSNFADNARFQWSSGDSLIGKEAIGKWWTDRRMNVIDSLQFIDPIWLPIKVNQPQQPTVDPGIWLLGWSTVRVKYKNKKSIVFAAHVDYHFNANDQVDRLIEYYDRAPINALLKK
jgi:hypothetical protein